jgi:hypothetical protein
MKNKSLYTILGFVLFMLGFISIVVNMVGLPFMLTDWIYLILGRTIGFFLKIVMIIAGIVIVVANLNSNDDDFDEYFDGKIFD